MRVALLVLYCAAGAYAGVAQRTAQAYEHINDGRTEYLSTCHAIQQAVSPASSVSYPLGAQWFQDISHWATSSNILSACSVEPGTVEDVAAILLVVGQGNTPFAVKGGGHSMNPGFSSTAGVQIAMKRFNEVTYHSDTQTVDLGSGLTWDDVYSVLEPLGINVVGGRVSGIGVAGFSLGGGYSWLTNQYGLTVDNIVGFELVTPDGTIRAVDSSTPDLFAALKGGYNNFGIVTKFTMKAYPQGQVWGGTITYGPGALDAVTDATAAFVADVTDPKAQLIVNFNNAAGIAILVAIIFYDGPTPPPGIFDDFLAISSLKSDISTRSFTSLVQSPGASPAGAIRGVFNTVSLSDITPNTLYSIRNESSFWGAHLALISGFYISYAVEPFLPSVFSHSTESDTVYPSSRARGLLPLNIFFAWELPTADSTMRSAVVQSATQITAAANAEGQDIGDAPLYGNYAIGSTPIERIWGDKLDDLRAVKQQYDPSGVMDLAGGFKLHV